MKRLVAILLLSLQLAHTSSALLAGAAHGAFHLTEQLRVEMQRAQQQRLAVILASHAHERLEGPDREPHRHPAPEHTPHVHGAHGEDAHEAVEPSHDRASTDARAGGGGPSANGDEGAAEAHTHAPAIDLLIRVAGPAKADAVAPTSSAQQGVDNQLPAAEASAPVGFVVTASHPADMAVRPSPILPPSPPPPRI